MHCGFYLVIVARGAAKAQREERVVCVGGGGGGVLSILYCYIGWAKKTNTKKTKKQKKKKNISADISIHKNIFLLLSFYKSLVFTYFTCITIVLVI